MKKIIAAALIGFLISSPVLAQNVKTSAMTAVGSVQSTDVFPLARSGNSTPYNASAAQIQSFMEGQANTYTASTNFNAPALLGGQNLISAVNKANRAPNNNDDGTQGYTGDGSIDHLVLATGATGCSGTPTFTIGAPATGGINATGHFMMNGNTAGTIVGAVLDIPGRGYTSNPSVTVSNTSGCSATPVVTAHFNPNGQLWNYKGKMYIARQTDASHAIWQFYGTPPLPLDAVANAITAAAVVSGGSGYATNDTIHIANGTILTVTGQTAGVITSVSVTTGGNWTCQTGATQSQVSTSGSGTGATFTVTVQTAQAAYGIQRLTQCYTTNKVADITRASDSAVQTIGFNQAGNGNLIDVSTIQKFCAGTTCTWSKWYDQSGNTNDATQSTGADQPALDFGQTINGLPVLLAGAMAIPSGAAYSQVNETVYMLTRSNPLMGNGSGLGGYLFNVGVMASEISSYYGFQNPAFGYSVSTNFAPARDPEIIGGTVSSATACTYSINDWEFNSGGNNCAQSGSDTGGAIGGQNSTSPQQMAAGMFVLWPRSFSAAERLAFRAATYATFNLVPQARSLIVTTGDSRTAGDYDTNGVDYPTQLESQLAISPRVFNVGTLGAQASTLVSNCFTVGNSGGACAAFTQPHDSNSYVIVWIGYNDGQNSVPAATSYTNLTTFIGYIHSIGQKVAVVVDPGAPSSYWPYQRNNTAGADLVIDMTQDPVWTGATNWTSQTFFASGPHPSVFGQSFVAMDIATGLNPVFH